DEFYFRLRNRVRHIHPNLVRRLERVPARARTLDREILSVRARRRGCGREGEVGDRHTWIRTPHQFQCELGRAHLRELRHARGDLDAVHGGAYAEDPARAAEGPLVRDRASVKKWRRGAEWHDRPRGWCDQLQMRPDVLIERAETLLEVVVVVRRQRAWVR